MKTIPVTYINTIKYVVTLEQDEWAESPREWDNLGTMLCLHRNYNLGDEPNVSWDEMESLVSQRSVVSLPLYLYDHSGITMSTRPFGDRWDSGQVGYIYVTHEDILKEFGGKRVTQKRIKQVLETLRDEVATYDTYIRGDIYTVTIKTDSGLYIDSCSGYYGDDYKELLDEHDVQDYELIYN